MKSELRASSRAKLPWHALTAIALWGLSFIAIRVALEGLHPFALVWTRMAMGAALLYAILAVRREALLPRREDRAVGVGLGLLLGGHLLIQSFAMQRTTAMRAGWLIAFVPVTIALGAHFVRGERLRALGWLGAGVASIGVLVLNAVVPSAFAEVGIGDWLMLGSCGTWATYTLLSIDPVARNGALRVTAFASAIAVVPNLIASLFTGQLTGGLTSRIVVAQLFLGLLSSGVALWAWNRSLAEIGAQKSGAVIYLQPFVTLAAALLVLHEPVTFNAIVGGAIVLLGVALLKRAQRSVSGP